MGRREGDHTTLTLLSVSEGLQDRTYCCTVCSPMAVWVWSVPHSSN